MFPPMWAHWHHLANMIELLLPSAHPSPQSKWQINRFSCFCTAYGRKSLYFTMGRPFFPQNCPFPRGIWTPSNTWFPGPIRVFNPNGISMSSGVFTGLTSVTDRQPDQHTNHATQSVTTDRIYIRSTGDAV